jgi:putative transposase
MRLEFGRLWRTSNAIRCALGLVDNSELYPWSSTRAHVIGQDHSGFLDMTTWTEFYSARRWRELLRIGVEEEALQARIRDATRSGRPFGSTEFLAEIERASDRQLKSRRVGRPKKIDPREEASQLEIGI